MSFIQSFRTSGITWMLAATLFFAVMGICVKEATATATFWQAVFFRGVASIPIVLAFSLRKGGTLWGVRPGLLIIRSVLGFMALSMFFFAVTRVHLGNATLLNATSPIFVLLLSGLLLKESVSRTFYVLLPFFFLGVALIVKPSSIQDFFPHFIALGSGFFSALAYLCVRKLGATERATTVVFYFSLITAMLSLPMAVTHWNPLPPSTLVLLVLIGAFATFAQLCMTRAYRLERAGIVAVFGYSTPVLAYVAGILFFDEMPNLASTLGALLVITCGVLAARSAIRRRSLI